MGRSDIITQSSQHGWLITRNTATFTISTVAFTTSASVLRRRWVTCLEWKIATHHEIILCTVSCGNLEMIQHTVLQSSSIVLLTLVGIFSGILRVSPAIFRNLTYF